MAEYIDREAAIKAIEFSKGVECSDRCVQGIKYIPAADVVEVVRCKDCKWYFHKFCYRCKDGNGVNIGHYASEMDYCSYGERKEG